VVATSAARVSRPTAALASLSRSGAFAPPRTSATTVTVESAWFDPNELVREPHLEVRPARRVVERRGKRLVETKQVVGQRPGNQRPDSGLTAQQGEAVDHGAQHVDG